MKRPVITLKSIRASKPCQKQYQLLRKAFPDGVPLTVESARRLARLDVSLLWYAARALKDEPHISFCKACRAADRSYLLATARYHKAYTDVLATGSGQDCVAAKRKYDLAIVPHRERQRFAEAKALLVLLLKEYERKEGER